MSDLPPIERLQSVRLEPGDTLIVGLPESLQPTEAEIQAWTRRIVEKVGDNPILFTQGQIEFGVVRKAAS